MLRTSIQACGTATTTLAKPKPSPVISTTRSSDCGIISRSRSSPVTPRCAAPWFELRGDFGGGEIGDLDAVEAGDGAAIIARAARLDEFEPGAREKASAFCCSRPFDGTARMSGALMMRLRHVNAAELVDRGGKADRRDRFLRAEPRQQTVVTAAGDQRALAARRIMQFEDEAGVIVEAAAEMRSRI